MLNDHIDIINIYYNKKLITYKNVLKDSKLVDLIVLNGLDKTIIKKSVYINNHIISISQLKQVTIGKLYEKLQSKTISIEIEKSIVGGSILDAFASIIQIGEFFLLIIDLVVWFVKFIAWLIFFIIWLLKFLFVDMIVDFYNSIVLIVITIFSIPLQILMACAAFFVNSIGGAMSSIFGWDQSNLTYNDRNSKYFQEIDRLKGKKCYLTNDNKVPFSILLGTILCPPLGVFMDLGATGWFNILICVLLTILFYFPGLIYALMIIYS